MKQVPGFSTCSKCKKLRPRERFSKKQLKSAAATRKCSDCTGHAPSPDSASTSPPKKGSFADTRCDFRHAIFLLENFAPERAAMELRLDPQVLINFYNYLDMVEDTSASVAAQKILLEMAKQHVSIHVCICFCCAYEYLRR